MLIIKFRNHFLNRREIVYRIKKARKQYQHVSIQLLILYQVIKVFDEAEEELVDRDSLQK